jgi:hypothetical protein
MVHNETQVRDVDSQKEESQEKAVPFFAHLLSTQAGNPEMTKKYPSDWED